MWRPVVYLEYTVTFILRILNLKSALNFSKPAHEGLARKLSMVYFVHTSVARGCAEDSGNIAIAKPR